MAQAFAEQLGWVGKSRTLADSLDRASGYAKKLGHAQVRLDHLLLALTEDLDAVMVLGACRVDTARLRMDLHQRLARVGPSVAPNDPRMPLPDDEMRKVFEYASQAADQSRRGHIDGAIVLAALIGEATTDAADLLRSYGMTFDEVIRSLQSMGPGTAAGPATQHPQSTPQPAGARTGSARPAPASAPSPVAAPPNLGRSASPVEVGPPQAPSYSYPTTRTAQANPVPDHAPAHGQRPPPAAPDGPPRQSAGYTNGAANGPYVNGHLGRPMPPVGTHPQVALPARIDRPAPALGRAIGTAGHPPPAPFDDLDPRLHPAPQGPPPHQQRPAPAVETGQLVEKIPRTMRAGIAETVELRIARAKMAALADGMQGQGPAHRHEIFITRAMSVRLRAPGGGFLIETMSPETQWLDGASRLGLAQDEFASWKFEITPERRGKAKLQVVVAARTVGADGLVAETSLPEQSIDVKVKINYGRVIKRVGGWAIAAALGGIIGAWGELAMRSGVASATKMVSRLFLPH